jgi:hypothetical protein
MLELGSMHFSHLRTCMLQALIFLAQRERERERENSKFHEIEKRNILFLAVF